MYLWLFSVSLWSFCVSFRPLVLNLVGPFRNPSTEQQASLLTLSDSGSRTQKGTVPPMATPSAPPLFSMMLTGLMSQTGRMAFFQHGGDNGGPLSGPLQTCLPGPQPSCQAPGPDILIEHTGSVAVTSHR